MSGLNSLSDFENYDFAGDLVQFRAADGFVISKGSGESVPFLDILLLTYRKMEVDFNRFVGASTKEAVISSNERIHAFKDNLGAAVDAARTLDAEMRDLRNKRWIRGVVHATPGTGPFLLKQPGQETREVAPDDLYKLIWDRQLSVADLIFRSGWKDEWRPYPKAFRNIAKFYLGAPPLPESLQAGAVADGGEKTARRPHP